MFIAGAFLVLLTMEMGTVTENFTGRVLDGSNDQLIRVERNPTPGKRPSSIVVLQDCGPLEPGTTHEFAIWANGSEPVRPCLAVNGKPPASMSRKMPQGFGLVYGQVRSIEENETRQLSGAPVEVRCGDKIWNGQADERGRFWTMLPAGTCYLDHQASGFRPVDAAPTPFRVREGKVDSVLLKLEPWGIKEKLQGLFRGVLPK